MDNLELITQNLDSTIKATIDTLTIHSIARIIRKLRRYGVKGEIELKFDSPEYVADFKSGLKSFEHHFDVKVKVYLIDQNEDVLISLKKELKDLFVFCFRFEHCAMKFSNNRTMIYNENTIIEELVWYLYQSHTDGAHYNIDEKSKKVIKEIQRLDILDEKNQLEKVMIEHKNHQKIKI